MQIFPPPGVSNPCQGRIILPTGDKFLSPANTAAPPSQLHCQYIGNPSSANVQDAFHNITSFLTVPLAEPLFTPLTYINGFLNQFNFYLNPNPIRSDLRSNQKSALKARSLVIGPR